MDEFPHHQVCRPTIRFLDDALISRKLAIYLSSLLSLLMATMLGFLDDVFDIRWRHKLPIPIIASIPLLIVYYSERGATDIVVPLPFRWMLGTLLHLGACFHLIRCSPPPGFIEHRPNVCNGLLFTGASSQILFRDIIPPRITTLVLSLKHSTVCRLCYPGHFHRSLSCGESWTLVLYRYLLKAKGRNRAYSGGDLSAYGCMF